MKIHLNWSQILNWIGTCITSEIASICPVSEPEVFLLFKVKAVIEKKKKLHNSKDKTKESLTSLWSNHYYTDPKITVFTGLLISHVNSSLLKIDKKNDCIRLFFQKKNNVKSHPKVKHLIFKILVLQGSKVSKSSFLSQCWNSFYYVLVK